MVVTLAVKARVCSRVIINMSVEALSIGGWDGVVTLNALDADVIV